MRSSTGRPCHRAMLGVERRALSCFCVQADEKFSFARDLSCRVLGGALAAAILVGHGYASMESAPKGEDDFKQLTNMVKTGFFSARQKILGKRAMKDKDGQVPRWLKVLCYPPLQDGKTYHISITLPGESALVALVALTGKPSGLNDFHSSDNQSGPQFSMVARDGLSSFTLTRTLHDPSLLSLHYFSESLPTDQQVATLAKAYESAWLEKHTEMARRSSQMSSHVDQGVGTHHGDSSPALQTLTEMGCTVYNKNSEDRKLDWNSLAGYEHVKREVEDTVLLSLKHPEEYNKIAERTREHFESNRPKAVLFDGPPGTGKTTTARIIASQVDVPLIYVPIESLVSKWYGDAEKSLAKVFDACEELGGSIVFIDEVDALATSRNQSGMHEATRRMLSVLLRRLDGFRQDGKGTLTVCATNRKSDLDAALLSRFDLM